VLEQINQNEKGGDHAGLNTTSAPMNTKQETRVKSELNELVEKLKQAQGQNLKSVVLYGPGVAGGLLDDESPKKVLVVLARMLPADLKKAHEVSEWWRQEGNPLPVYFTEEEIADASDVFPIDFLDMAEVRHVLFGQDPFAGLDISTENLRHQLEYELRGKLIRLRTLYVPAARNPNRLARLMVDSLNSFAPLFRHVLRLLNDDAPVEQREAIIRLSERLGLEKSTFVRIDDYEKDEEAWLETETNQTFASYLDQVSRVVEEVDRLAGRPE
jgi:hypothetical protein